MSKAASETLTWVADVPLLTNPVIWRAMVLMLAIAYLLVALIFGLVLAGGGHLERLPSFMATMALAFAAVVIVLVLVMLVVFRNRMRCHFVVDGDGVTSVVVDRTAAIAGSLATLAGAAGADALLAGAGLGTVGARREYTRWSRVASADYFPDRHAIRLKAAGWWPVGAIHCTAETYATVAATVREILDERRA